MQCKMNLRAKAARALCLLALSLPLVAGAQAQTQAIDNLLRQGDQETFQGKLYQARLDYERALRAGANFQNDATHSRNLGLAYLNSAPPDFAKAARWLQNAWRLQPRDEDTHLALAQALSWSGNYAAAAEHWQSLHDAHPRVAAYAEGLAGSLYSEQKPDDAFQVLREYIGEQPSNIAVRLDYARMLGYSRKFDEAMEQYQGVLQVDPANLQAQAGMAKVLSWQNQFEGALSRFDNILKQHPGYYDALVGKAFTLAWMGKSREATPLFERASRMNPRDKEVISALHELRKAEPGKAVALAKPQPAPPNPPAPAVSAAVQPPPVAPVQPAPEIVATTPAEPPAPVNPVPGLIHQAQAAANAGNFDESARIYADVLQREPDNMDARMARARVLSWGKNYSDSIIQYDQILAAQPNNLEAHLEKANVLSWSKDYEQAIPEYDRVIRGMEEMENSGGTPAAGVVPATSSLHDVRLQLAQVLSWDRRYQEAEALLDQMAPASRAPQASDKSALLLKARVYAYDHKYDQSLATYDSLAQLDAGNFDARLGKAETLYWSGHLEESAALLDQLSNERPGNAEVKFTLAAVEHWLGNDSRALTLLAATQTNSDVAQLRRSINEGLRPVLRTRFGWEDDLETDAPALSQNTARTLRYTASLAFSVTPEVRMEVSNTVSTGDTSNLVLASRGLDGLATESMARIMFRPRHWLQLSLGAGDGTTGVGTACSLPLSPDCSNSTQAERRHHLVYDLHPVITDGDFRLDVTAGRHVADYTPLAIHDNVVQRREGALASYFWRKRVRFAAEYWHSNYEVDLPGAAAGSPSSFETNANGGDLSVTPVLYRTDRVIVEAGMRYDAFGFDDGSQFINSVPPAGGGSAGFFAPRFYQRYAGTGHIGLERKYARLDLSGTFGPQRVFAYDTLVPTGAGIVRVPSFAPRFGATESAEAQLTFKLGRLQPYVAYDYFTTATPGGPTLTGSWESHAAVVGLSFRF